MVVLRNVIYLLNISDVDINIIENGLKNTIITFLTSGK